jgi:hypothetical protein
MLATISYRQLKAWRDFDELEPIGGRRSDWQAASICATVFNSVLIRTKSKKRFKPSDFVLEYGAENPRPSGKQTWQEQKMIAMMFAKAFTEQPKPKRRRK